MALSEAQRDEEKERRAKEMQEMVRRAQMTTEDIVLEALRKERAILEAKHAAEMQQEKAKQEAMQVLIETEKSKIEKIQREHKIALEKLKPSDDNQKLIAALDSVVKGSVVKCQKKTNLSTVSIPDMIDFSKKSLTELIDHEVSIIKYKEGSAVGLCEVIVQLKNGKSAQGGNYSES